MKVTIATLTPEALEERDFMDALSISVDGKEMINLSDGEPEDNTLSRNFNDVFEIPELLKLVWEAGKSGDDLVIEEIEVDE